MSRVAFLQSEEELVADQELSAFKAATQALGVEFLLVLHKPSDYAEAFTRITNARPDGLLVAASSATMPIDARSWSSRQRTDCRRFTGPETVLMLEVLFHMEMTPRSASDKRRATLIGF